VLEDVASTRSDSGGRCTETACPLVSPPPPDALVTSDCTTAPRNGLVSGCYPLDAHYKKSDEAKRLAAIKKPAQTA